MNPLDDDDIDNDDGYGDYAAMVSGSSASAAAPAHSLAGDLRGNVVARPPPRNAGAVIAYIEVLAISDAAFRKNPGKEGVTRFLGLVVRLPCDGGVEVVKAQSVEL